MKLGTTPSTGRVSLPDARYFALTWGIPEAYGGMTTVLLHRSRALEQLGGKPVEVLTFDSRPDYPTLEHDLHQRGELLPAMRLINLWDWLREYTLPSDAPGSLDLGRHPFTPLESLPDYASTYRDGHELSRTRHGADDQAVLQVDYYRLDGSLLVSDRRDTTKPGTLGGRSVTLCDRASQPVRSWGSIWALYRYWLDRLRGDSPSVMIIDSKTVAKFMLGYRRKNAITVHVIHGSHLTDDDGSAPSLRESRRPVFENFAGFDAVVVLTQRQKADIERDFGQVRNLCVIPHSVELESQPHPKLARPIGRGVVIASLSPIKRVDAAVRAAIDAASRSSVPMTLDVFGEGSERSALELLIQERDAVDIVRMRGHRSDARAQLAEASYLLLSSRSEGFSLAILESMAAGCIPIAYDVPYGPADLITHRQNGFLVPAGDEVRLADTILELQGMTPRKVAALRKNARHTAESFSSLAATRRWGQELSRAKRRKA